MAANISQKSFKTHRCYWYNTWRFCPCFLLWFGSFWRPLDRTLKSPLTLERHTGCYSAAKEPCFLEELIFLMMTIVCSKTNVAKCQDFQSKTCFSYSIFRLFLIYINLNFPQHVYMWWLYSATNSWFLELNYDRQIACCTNTCVEVQKFQLKCWCIMTLQTVKYSSRSLSVLQLNSQPTQHWRASPTDESGETHVLKQACESGLKEKWQGGKSGLLSVPETASRTRSGQ